MNRIALCVSCSRYFIDDRLLLPISQERSNMIYVNGLWEQPDHPKTFRFCQYWNKTCYLHRSVRWLVHISIYINEIDSCLCVGLFPYTSLRRCYDLANFAGLVRGACLLRARAYKHLLPGTILLMTSSEELLARFTELPRYMNPILVNHSPSPWRKLLTVN